MEETREEKHERMFFKAVKRRRNEYQPKLNLLKDKQGNIVGEEGKIINRCADHIKNYQRDALKIIYSSNITLLYMFQVSSTHLQEDKVVHKQHMVPSLSIRVLVSC